MIFFISNRWAAHHGAKKAKLELRNLNNYLDIKTRICMSSIQLKCIQKRARRKESMKDPRAN